jgi:prepilin-type N-terminal cleavage/methylation domain-containing protein
VLRRSRRTAADAGFTLVELLISITLMGIVLTTVVAVSFVAVHTAAAADTRLDDSNDLVRAATYFGDDVQGAQSVTVDAEPLCGTDDDAVVEFSGQDFADDSTLAITTTVVTYVVRGADDADADAPELHRLSCRADSTGPLYPLTPVSDVTVALGLSDSAPLVSCGGSACGAGFSQVELTVTESGGLSYTLTGRRRTSP